MNQGLMMLKLWTVKFVLIVFLSPHISLSWTPLFVYEGEVAHLRYDYDIVNDVEFQLQTGHKDAFFKYGQIYTDELSPSQQKRFLVNAWKSVSEKTLLVSLQINDAERNDAGTYICKLIKNGEVLPSSTKIISLHVDFPPSKVHCWLLPHTEYDQEILQCAARGGIPPGNIACFQNEKKVLPLGLDLNINETHILEKFWVDRNLPLSCCSHSGFHVPSDTCHDFQLPPAIIKQENETIATTQIIQDIQTKNTLTSGLNISDISDLHKSSSRVTVIAVPVTLFSLVLIVMSIAFSIRYHKLCGYRKVKSNDDSLKDDDRGSALMRTTKSLNHADDSSRSNDGNKDGAQTKLKYKINSKSKAEFNDSHLMSIETMEINLEKLHNNDSKTIEMKEEKDGVSSHPPLVEPPTTENHLP